MKSVFPMQAIEYVKAHAGKARWRKVVTVLACIVVFCTTYALILPAITMAQEQTFCGYEAHTHGDDCYAWVLVCPFDAPEDENGAVATDHVHGESCYVYDGAPICGLSDAPAHTHGADCFDESGEVICPLEGGEGHTHSSACYDCEPILVCGQEELHYHVESCYEKRLECTMEEHEHVLSCYSDTSADLETAAVWERTVPQELSGVWADDVLAAAKSQLGYAASTRNYQVDENNGVHGYTRYGAWYGYPYGEWCAMFASFCLHYGGVDDADFPYASGCVYWTEKLVERDLYARSGDYTPKAGDLVFFDTDGDGQANHVGIVLSEPDADGLFRTIEGNVDGCVQARSHALNEETLFGYGVLPENPEKAATDEIEAEGSDGNNGQNDENNADSSENEEKIDENNGNQNGDDEASDENGNQTEPPAENEAAREPICGLNAHMHGTDCYAEDGTLICELDEHTHGTTCYPAEEEDADAETRTPICGKEAHEHIEECYDEAGDLVCTLEAHTHGESCYAAAQTQEFTYRDSELSLTLTVAGEEPLPEGTELTVQSMDAESIALLADEDADESTWLVRYLALTQGEEMLDTSAYTMTIALTVERSVLAPLFEALDALEDIAPEADKAIVLRLMQEDEEAGLKEVQTLSVAPDASEPVTLTATVQSGAVAVSAGGANPQYTVQYYANIPRFATSGAAELTVFDTAGKNKPTNDTTNKTKSIYLEATGNKKTQHSTYTSDIYEVATKLELTQMYTEENFHYVTAPNPRYINKLEDNADYTLKEVWVLKSGKDEDSTGKDDWDVYEVDEVTDVHFTNRKDVATSNPGKNVIFIDDNTVIRLVYDVAEGELTTPANFYDYDITNEKDEKDGNGYWKTEKRGINSKENYDNATTYDSGTNVLAFGNVNCGSGLGNYKFDGVYLNKYSGGSASTETHHNMGCTFGLADSYNQTTQHIVYTAGLTVPNLFNEGYAKGKTSYTASDGSSLTFKRVGDTYTLSKATVGKGVGTITNLDQFFNPAYPDKLHTTIYTNNFWPLDNATDRSDGDWGKYVINNKSSRGTFVDNSGNVINTFPPGDDGYAHNWFFGMMFAIKFTLDEDYIGPLDYTFFGDDDMWVFLDSTLVCDIGGVHSSVGEYVNLWDYLDDGDRGETHTLTFFYTERGASGSTCYMNFTLPSVSGVNIEQKTASMTVAKELTGSESAAEAGEEFEFEIQFFDVNGKAILNDYSYTRYDKDGNIPNDGEDEAKLVLHDGSTFKLKAGEHIKIDHLPIGLRYTVTEVGAESSGYTVTNTINGVLASGSSATGTIIKDAENKVTFTNTRGKTGLMLQKQDAYYKDESGLPKPLTGASFQIKDANDNLLQFTDDGDGVYTLATKGTVESSEALYYIASAAHPEYVLGRNGGGGNKTGVVLRSITDTANAMQLRLQRNDNGSYSFQDATTENKAWLNLDSGKCENGATVHLWESGKESTNAINDMWFLTQNSDGSFVIQPYSAVVNSKKFALDVASANFADGTTVQLYEINGSNAQNWLLVPVDTTEVLSVDDNGVLNLKGLAAGTYTLNEVGAPEGFKPITADIQIKVDSDGKITVLQDAGGLVSTDDSGLVLYVKNEHEDVELTLTKELINSNTTQKFEFTVSYKDASGETVEKSVKIKGGESENVTGIPYGAEVTITEGAHDGFTVTYKNGDAVLERTEDGNGCTITMTSNMTIVAVNEAGYALPSTGGAGNRAWLMGGMALVFGVALTGAGAALRRRRRQHSKSA